MPKKQKQKQKNIFNIEAIDTEELRKSIARDLQVPDRPLTLKEIQEIEFVNSLENPMTPAIDWSRDDSPTEAELRFHEGLLIDEVDEELNENT